MSLDFAKTLVGNIINFRNLETEKLPADCNRDELMAYLHQKSETTSAILAENNEIINNKLRPILKDIENVSRTVANQLFELASGLFDLNKTLDPGLSLEIQKALLHWGNVNDDVDFKVRSHYYIGMIYSQINFSMRRWGNHKFSEIGLKNFQAGAVFKEQYFEIENPETRNYIHRCLAGVYRMFLPRENGHLEREFVEEFMRHHNVATTFWADEKVRSSDPDFAWNSFKVNSSQNICGWLPVLHKSRNRHEYLPLIKQINESFEFLKSQKDGNFRKGYWNESRMGYADIIIQFCLGKITHNETTKELRKLLAEIEMHDYSQNSVVSMLFISSMLITHMMIPENANEDEEVKKAVEEIAQKVSEYCKNIASDVDKTTLHNNLFLMLSSVGPVLETGHFIDLLLICTTLSHFPTLAHSIVVQRLSRTFASYLLTEQPESFIGVLGTKSVSDVLKNRSAILKLIDRAAMCHDIGKMIYTDTVSLTSRNLYEFEYDIIKEHANVAHLIRPTSERARFFASVTSDHHKYHDETKGYPERTAPISEGYKFLVDIISVSDSIDAATDTIGRSFSECKSIEQIVQEIIEQSGTRYSPLVAGTLQNQDVLEQIKDCVTSGRADAYFQAYKQVAPKS